MGEYRSACRILSGRFWIFGSSLNRFCPALTVGCSGCGVRSVLDAPEARRSIDHGAPEQCSDTGEVEKVG